MPAHIIPRLFASRIPLPRSALPYIFSANNDKELYSKLEIWKNTQNPLLELLRGFQLFWAAVPSCRNYPRLVCLHYSWQILQHIGLHNICRKFPSPEVLRSPNFSQSLLTWFVVVYHFTTLYVSSLKGFRIPYAVMGVDAVMVIFWLSAMGASAALRASFKYKVTIDGCYNNGSLVNSSTCIVERGMEKRAAVATSTGLSIMSAIAGLSALEL